MAVRVDHLRTGEEVRGIRIQRLDKRVEGLAVTLGEVERELDGLALGVDEILVIWRASHGARQADLRRHGNHGLRPVGARHRDLRGKVGAGVGILDARQGERALAGRKNGLKPLPFEPRSRRVVVALPDDGVEVRALDDDLVCIVGKVAHVAAGVVNRDRYVLGNACRELVCLPGYRRQHVGLRGVDVQNARGLGDEVRVRRRRLHRNLELDAGAAVPCAALCRAERIDIQELLHVPCRERDDVGRELPAVAKPGVWSRRDDVVGVHVDVRPVVEQDGVQRDGYLLAGRLGERYRHLDRVVALHICACRGCLRPAVALERHGDGRLFWSADADPPADGVLDEFAGGAVHVRRGARHVDPGAVVLRACRLEDKQLLFVARRYLDRQHPAVDAAYVVRLRFANGRQYRVVLGPDPHSRIARPLERCGGIDDDGWIAELRRLGRALGDGTPDIRVGVGAGGRHVDVVGVKVDRLYVHRLPLKGGVAPRGARLVCARIGRGIPLAARKEPVVSELVAAEAEICFLLKVVGVCGVDRVHELGIKAWHDHVKLVGCSRHLAAVRAP